MGFIKNSSSKLIFLVILILVILVTALFFLTRNNQNQVSFFFEDRTQHAQIAVNTSVMEDIINVIYEDGLLLFVNNSYQQRKTIHPTKLSLILVDEPQPLIQTRDLNSQEIVFSLSQIYQNNHLFLYLQLHPDFYKYVKDGPKKEILMGSFVKSFYYTSPFVQQKNDKTEGEALSELEKYYLEKIPLKSRLLLKLKENQADAFIQKLSFLLKNTFTRQVYAGTCPTDKVWCGDYDGGCTCSEAGYTCTADDQDCGLNGTCSCDYTKKCKDVDAGREETCYGDIPDCKHPCGATPEGESLLCDGSCGCSNFCGSWGSWSSCDNTCGSGDKSRTRTCYNSSCSSYTDSETEACDDCSGCANSCTLCGASCGSWCGPKTVTGKKNCGVTACESNCDYYCGCNKCSPNCVTYDSPANGSNFRNVPHVDLDWHANSWGAGCDDSKSFNLCIGDGASNCNFLNNSLGENNSDYRFTESGTAETRLNPGTYYWDVDAVNNGQTCQAADQTFSVTQQEKECTVTINDSSQWPTNWATSSPTVSVTVWGHADASYATDTVGLFVEQVDGSSLPTNDISPAAGQNGGFYHITDAGLTGCGLSECGPKTTTITLPTMGNYYFHCDLPNDPQKCSGNPFCSYEDSTVYGQSKPAPYAMDCSGWESCDDAPTDSPTSSDNVYYCAGAGVPYVEISSPTNSRINMTSETDADSNGIQDITVSWTDQNAGHNGDQKANDYDVRIYQRDSIPDPSNPTTANCSDADVFCLDDTTSTSAIYNPPNDPNNPDREYTMAVRARNTTCNPYIPINTYVSDWVYFDFDLVANITGTIINDPDNSAQSSGDLCLDPIGTDDTAVDPLDSYFANISLTGFDSFSPDVTVDRTASATDGVINNNGTYTITVPYFPWTSSAEYYLRLDATNLQSLDQDQWYTCSTCSSDPDLVENGNPLDYRQFNCQYLGVYAPQSGVDFYLSTRDLTNDPWWQVTGGNVMARGDIVALIPNSLCENDPASQCKPYLVSHDIGLTPNYDNDAGIPMTSNGVVDSEDSAGNGTGYTTELNPPFYLNGSGSHDFTPIYRGYSYFANRINLDEATAFGSDTLTSLPSLTGSNETDIFTYSGDLTINPSSTWTVQTGQKMIVMVSENASGNANLFIEGNSSFDQLIQVETGGFLAFIVQGSIVFNQDVGTEITYDTNGHSIIHQTQPNVEGVYLADELLIVADDGPNLFQPDNEIDAAGSRDKKFIGAGTFVGWQDVRLHRSFEDDNVGKELHSWSPTVLFRYRPDFAINIPYEMTSAQYEWREAEPQKIN